MKVQPRGIGRQTKGPLVADEMHLVAATGKFFPQRRGQHAAAADRGITGNSDSKSALGRHIKSG